MITISATTEKTAQSIFIKTLYKAGSTSEWWSVRSVAWISQNTTTFKTTLYTKWQVGSNNYWPKINDVYPYTVSLGSTTRSASFNPKGNKSNIWIDKSKAQSFVINHNTSTGEATPFELHFTGVANGIAFDEVADELFTVPKITATPGQSQDGTQRAPIVDDLDPKFYILADGDVLYAPNDESLKVIDPKLTLEINQTDSLEFTIPAGHPMYDELRKLKTTIEVRQGKEVLFRGRILDDNIDFLNRKTVHCEGALAFLNDTIMPPYKVNEYAYAWMLFKDAIEKHASQVPNSTPYRKIVYTSCDINAPIELENSEYSQTTDIIRQLLSDIGGFIRLEYFEDGTTGISYLSTVDHTSSQTIEFAENLVDISRFIDASNVYTSVVCLGKADEETGDRIATGSGSAMYVENQTAIKTFGRIIRIFTYDDVTSQTELRKIATNLLAMGVEQGTTITAKAVDLHVIDPDIEKIRVGDYVRIRSIPHGLDSYFQCNRIDIDISNAGNTTYEFGTPLKALTDTPRTSYSKQKRINP